MYKGVSEYEFVKMNSNNSYILYLGSHIRGMIFTEKYFLSMYICTLLKSTKSEPTFFTHRYSISQFTSLFIDGIYGIR